MSDIFLGKDDIKILTGLHRKSAQVAWFRQSGIPFFINASGRPVVTRAAIEGRETRNHIQGWQPSVVAK